LPLLAERLATGFGSHRLKVQDSTEKQGIEISSGKSACGTLFPDYRVLGRNTLRLRLLPEDELPICHFLGHVEKKLAVGFLRPAQKASKFVEITGVLTATAPGDVVG
jgi:hypothetical protein